MRVRIGVEMEDVILRDHALDLEAAAHQNLMPLAELRGHGLRTEGGHNQANGQTKMITAHV